MIRSTHLASESFAEHVNVEGLFGKKSVKGIAATRVVHEPEASAPAGHSLQMLNLRPHSYVLLGLGKQWFRRWADILPLPSVSCDLDLVTSLLCASISSAIKLRQVHNGSS